MKRQRTKVRTYFEKFKNAGTVYTGYSQNEVYTKERCKCEHPVSDYANNYECTCVPYIPPWVPFPFMEEGLFRNPKPMLMFSISNSKNPDILISFFCKIEQEAYEEVQRLNQKNDNQDWYYVEEEVYNSASRAEHKKFLEYKAIYEQ